MELCTVGMIQTVRRRLKTMDDDYKIIMVDEAHTNSKAYKSVFERYPDAIKIGFSATPVRLGEGGLGNLFESLVVGTTTKWLIDNGFLSKYRYYSIPLVDASKLHTRAGDYVQEEVNEIMEKSAVYSGAVDQWMKFAKGKKTMVYCSSIKSSKEIASEFADRGISACHVDGTTPKEERNEIVRKFRSGEITVLSNSMLFSEGYDDKEIECCILLRPTLSLALYIQQSMRALRPMDGKTAIILDCCGNVYRHGLPDDDREWSLKPKHQQENVVKVRECKNCFAVYPPTMKRCPYCGYEATTEIQTKEMKTVEVDLVEVKRQNEIRNTRLRDAEFNTWEEIVEFQKIHGYKFMWCLRCAIANGIQFPSKYNYMARHFMKV